MNNINFDQIQLNFMMRIDRIFKEYDEIKFDIEKSKKEEEAKVKNDAESINSDIVSKYNEKINTIDSKIEELISKFNSYSRDINSNTKMLQIKREDFIKSINKEKEKIIDIVYDNFKNESLSNIQDCSSYDNKINII